MRRWTLLSLMILAPFLAAAVPASGQAGSPPGGSAETEQALSFLLASAADDFRQSDPGTSVRVRDVRLARVPTTTGKPPQYQLCGEFTAGGEKREWAKFATVKTSGYEQWTGAAATGLCGREDIAWEEVSGLTESLQRKLDAH